MYDLQHKKFNTNIEIVGNLVLGHKRVSDYNKMQTLSDPTLTEFEKKKKIAGPKGVSMN